MGQSCSSDSEVQMSKKNPDVPEQPCSVCGRPMYATTTTSPPVCGQCQRAGNGYRLGTGGDSSSATAGLQTAAAQSDAERARRAQAAEGRMRFSGGKGARDARPTPPAASSAGTDQSVTRSAGPPAEGSNPVLEAALRRQAQKQQQGPAQSTMSAEKAQLHREIQSILKAHNEDPPFGLQSSDEGKLRSYLKYLKEKYHYA